MVSSRYAYPPSDDQTPPSDLHKASYSVAPATTAMSCYGCHRRLRPHRHMERTGLKTRRHGVSSTCVVPWAPRFTTLPGLRMGNSSSPAAWTTLPEYTIHKAARHTTNQCRDSADRQCRQCCQTDRRTQPLCARRCVGPAQRVHRDSVVGSIGTHMAAEDEGWSILACTAQQGDEDGPPSPPHILEQPCTPRLQLKATFCGRHSVICSRVTRAFYAWNTPISCFADESSSNVS